MVDSASRRARRAARRAETHGGLSAAGLMPGGARADSCGMATPAATLRGAAEARPWTIQRVLGARAVTSAYQPLVDLDSGETIGFEALARGPRDSAFERPDRLFAAAALAGLEREVEFECQRAALQGALEAGLAPGQALFINVEPRLLAAERPPGLDELARRAAASFPVFVEFTERSLTDRPAELLATARWLRAQGVGIALDDVGADPRSLGLMPVLAPDVIKLDLRLVQEQPSRQIASIVHAVNAEAERTGAEVLAEGIETEEHRQTALALGARYGQGFMFGRPGPLRNAAGTPGRAPSRRPVADDSAARTPFGIVTAGRTPRHGTKRLLLAMSRQIEAQASSLGRSALVLSAFQDRDFFTPATAGRYRELAAGAALVGALGAGLPDRPVVGVRGGALAAGDPLCGEWDVAVVGPHFAAAFAARDLGDRCADMDRRFDFAFTYERSTAIAVARNMISRLAAVPGR